MRTITKTVYYYDELDDEAKERALNSVGPIFIEEDWAECTIEEIVQLGTMLGLRIYNRTAHLYNGETREVPAVYFDTDRHEFTYNGRYCRKQWKEAAAKLYGYSDTGKQDDVFCEFLAEWAAYERRLSSACADITVDIRNGRVFDYGEDITADDENTLAFMIDSFCELALQLLNKQYEFLQSREYKEDFIRNNEYEFDSDGDLV